MARRGAAWLYAAAVRRVEKGNNETEKKQRSSDRTVRFSSTIDSTYIIIYGVPARVCLCVSVCIMKNKKYIFYNI